jgi:hypothetical protein
MRCYNPVWIDIASLRHALRKSSELQGQRGDHAVC